MTEFELRELLATNSFAAVEVFVFWTTAITGYLVTAYLAGRQLTTIQATTISVLFVFVSLMAIWASFAYMARAIEVADSLELLHPGKFFGAQPVTQKGMLVIKTLGIIACVKFMWDVRHPKNNE